MPENTVKRSFILETSIRLGMGLSPKVLAYLNHAMLETIQDAFERSSGGVVSMLSSWPKDGQSMVSIVDYEVTAEDLAQLSEAAETWHKQAGE